MRKTMKRGFTLAEVLVTVAVVAVVAAVVVPAVVRQITAGDPSRVAQDLRALRTGIENFNLNTRAYPDEIFALVDSTGQPSGWRGPYLEKTIDVNPANDAEAFQTGFGASIFDGLLTCPYNGNFSSGIECTTGAGGDEYVTVVVVGLDGAQFGRLNDLLDAGTTSSTGRLRQNHSASTTFYLAYPVVTN